MTKTVDPKSLSLEEQVERWQHLAETMMESAERYKQERDELLAMLPTMQLAEQFMATFLAFQQQLQKLHPEGYTIITPNGPVVLSTTGFTYNGVGRQPEEKVDG